MGNHTAVADPTTPDPPGRTGMSAGDKVRLGLRGLGELLITAGVVVLLFVVYEVWVTNIFAHEKQAKVRSALEKTWAKGSDPLLQLPGSRAPSIRLGTGIANIYLPRLGSDFHFTIVEGASVPTDSQLEQGPVHYKDTALPGQVGNFAVAGHRVGKGEPFLNLDQLRTGDAVIIETESRWYVYTVLGSPDGANPQSAKPGVLGVPGREITTPSGISNTGQSVLNPVPDHPTSTPPKYKFLTMTTCTPKFTASHRMIVHAMLTDTVAKKSDGGTKYSNVMPEQISSLYSKVKS